MMDWSDRHCRMFWRQISQQALLYTEMVTTGAILHAGPERFLRFNDEEHPIALQLGGSNAKELALCCKMAEDYGYNEVNLNVGCPSDRVQNNMIGACLMGHADIVNECLSEMAAATSLPATVKHRIGIDTGSYKTKGRITAAIFESNTVRFISSGTKKDFEVNNFSA